MPKRALAIKKYKILFLPIARRDLFEIGAFIAADSVNRALSYLDKVHSKIRLLSKHPKIGIIPKDKQLKAKGYRILIVDSYLVFYVIQKKIIKIRRILHGSRDLESIIL